jgi:hypothetical protein
MLANTRIAPNGNHPPKAPKPPWPDVQEEPEHLREYYGQQWATEPPAAKQPAAQATEPALTPDIDPFNFLTLEDLLNLPPKEWIIENVIGAGDLAMVYGAPGSGKTFVVIDLIFAACIGQTFAMRFNVDRPLNVAYAAGEGVSGLPMRFAAAASFYGVDKLPNLTFVDNTPQLFDFKISTSIQAFVAQWKKAQETGKKGKLDIFVIDTLHSATAGADENSSQDMGTVLASAKYAARELGCAVILVHHTNKSGSAERGSSSLRGAMDCMIEVKRISEHSTKSILECEKLKDGEAWKAQTFDLAAMGESVRVWWDNPGDMEGDKRKTQTGRQILQLMTGKAPLTSKQISDALGATPQVINKVLARLVTDKLITRDQDDRKRWIFAMTDEGDEALRSPNPI